jgi:GGDEF domain-containing protein
MYGHHIGDRVIKYVATSIDTYDSHRSGEYTGRLAGDEIYRLRKGSNIKSIASGLKEYFVRNPFRLTTIEEDGTEKTIEIPIELHTHMYRADGETTVTEMVEKTTLEATKRAGGADIKEWKRKL